MSLEKAVSSLILPILEEQGLVLVQVKKQERTTLQIMVEQEDGASPTVEQCAYVSREMSALLEVEDILPNNCRLEVTSPGVDRPLLGQKDFERFQSRTAKVRFTTPIEGLSSFVGEIKTVNDAEQTVLLVRDNEEVLVPLAEIADAHLEFTNADMAKLLKKGK